MDLKQSSPNEKAEFRKAFNEYRPVCMNMLKCLTVENVDKLLSVVSEMTSTGLKGNFYFILTPFLAHLDSKQSLTEELLLKLINGVKTIAEKIEIIQCGSALQSISKLEFCIYKRLSTKNTDDSISEEVKLAMMECLTTVMINMVPQMRLQMLKTHKEVLAQIIFVCTIIAKEEKLRSLRIAALHCLAAHAGVHKSITDNKYYIEDPVMEKLVIKRLQAILPGVLGALHDVALDRNNPGHMVTVTALNVFHRILCMTMQDKLLPKQNELSMTDFLDLYKAKIKNAQDKEKSEEKDVKMKDIPKGTQKWYDEAAKKLLPVLQSLLPLRSHEHFKVRKEFAIVCARLTKECNKSLKVLVPVSLDVLLCLSNDDYPQVSGYSSKALSEALESMPPDIKQNAMESICKNFYDTLVLLPRILTDIDTNRKLSTLNLIYGYIQLLLKEPPPQRLTVMLSSQSGIDALCIALIHAATIQKNMSTLTLVVVRDVRAFPPTRSPWAELEYLDTEIAVHRLRDICRSLAEVSCSGLIVDRLMEFFNQGRPAEAAYILNWLASALTSNPSLAHRVVNKYIEEWDIPMEVKEHVLSLELGDTLDPDVYDPTAWQKETIPDLFEGTIESRYIDIGYKQPPGYCPPSNSCSNLRQAQANVTTACVLTEGMGMMALRLRQDFQQYLLKTLCPLLDRLGNMYELVHLAGLKAMKAVAIACGYNNAGQLIRYNADYFTSVITRELKKAWQNESAIQTLMVVMEYSDGELMDPLYGIVKDVLLQSCDKFHKKDVTLYLRVFFTFVQRIWKLRNVNDSVKEYMKKIEVRSNFKEIDIAGELIKYITNVEEAEKLEREEDCVEESGMSTEEMYKEDIMKKEEENVLDYDDKVTDEKPELPQYIIVTKEIIKRCINFIPSKIQTESLLAMTVTATALAVLKDHEDELLPLVHQVWSPLVCKFDSDDPLLLRQALDLIVAVAVMTGDFIRERYIQSVAPKLYKILERLASKSKLRDAGSVYRQSAAYQLQLEMLSVALPILVVHLRLRADQLRPALHSALLYLSDKQPMPLQESAIFFFRITLDYDYGLVWQYLRTFCNNEHVLEPPLNIPGFEMSPVTSTPYEPKNEEYKKNIKQIFELYEQPIDKEKEKFNEEQLDEEELDEEELDEEELHEETLDGEELDEEELDKEDETEL